MGFEDCEPLFVTHMLGYGLETSHFIDAIENYEEYTVEMAIQLLETMCQYAGWADTYLKELKEYFKIGE